LKKLVHHPRTDNFCIDLQDGTIPKLHITTDLLAMLIPGLPKAYPKQFVRIETAATSMPSVSFTVNGTLLKVRAPC
jgi:hypothetical protein